MEFAALKQHKNKYLLVFVAVLQLKCYTGSFGGKYYNRLEFILKHQQQHQWQNHWTACVFGAAPAEYKRNCISINKAVCLSDEGNEAYWTYSWQIALRLYFSILLDELGEELWWGQFIGQI